MTSHLSRLSQHTFSTFLPSEAPVQSLLDVLYFRDRSGVTCARIHYVIKQCFLLGQLHWQYWHGTMTTIQLSLFSFSATCQTYFLPLMNVFPCSFPPETASKLLHRAVRQLVFQWFMTGVIKLVGGSSWIGFSPLNVCFSLALADSYGGYENQLFKGNDRGFLLSTKHQCWSAHSTWLSVGFSD